MKKRKKQVVSVLLSICLFLAMLPAAALAAEGDLPYRYWDGGAWQTGTLASGTYTTVQSSDVDLGEDGKETWYVVSGDVSINNHVEGSGLTDTLFVRGTVHLVLMDGSILNCGRIVTRANSSLYIHAQSDGESMGKLKAGGGIGEDASEDVNVNIVIYGGSIEGGAGAVPVIGGYQGGYTVTAYDSVITLLNERGGPGIYADDVILQGCRVNVHSTQHNGIYGKNSVALTDGEATILSDTSNGIYSSGDVSISGSTVNVTAGDGMENTCGILAGGNLIIEKQAKVEVENKGTAAAMEGAAGITVSASEVTSTSDISNGILTQGVIRITDGANVSASGAYPSIWTRAGAEIDGSTVKLSGQSDGIWTPDGGISICNGSEVTANVTGGALAAGGGNITVSGSQASLSSENGNGMYAGAGAIEITDGSNVTASGKNPALFANSGITVSGSRVQAESGNDVGIYSPKSAVITDSVVTARGGNSNQDILVRTKDGSAVSGSWVDGTYGDSFASVENTMSVGNGIAAVTGAAAVPQDVTLPQGTKIIIPEGGSLKIKDNVIITSLPSGEDTVVDENGNIELPGGAVLTVDGNQITVPAEGGSVNLGGDVNVGPTPDPTAGPTTEPTSEPDPTADPTTEPSSEPTTGPTAEPTSDPTTEPTAGPTAEPTSAPTTEPTAGPTAEPTSDPTTEPTAGPTAEPTSDPTTEPTSDPTTEPTAGPTAGPTAEPGPTPGPAHIHNWSGAWKSDAACHWHDCIAEGCNVTENSGKAGYGIHVPGDWITDRQPAGEEAGSRHRQCVVCGAVTETEEIPAAGDQAEGDPFIRNEQGQKGWNAVKESAGKAEENSIVDIIMNGASTVPGAVLDTVKGRDVTLAFDMGDSIVWIVNGKQVTGDKVSDIDLSVKMDSGDIPAEMVQNTAAGNASVRLSLAHNGDFGFSATLFLNLGKENHGFQAVLYYYNKAAGRLETVGRSEISETGTADFLFTHASDYLVVIEKNGDNGNLSEEAGPSDDSQEAVQSSAPVSPSTGEKRNLWMAAAIGFLMLAAVQAFRGRRQQRNK